MFLSSEKIKPEKVIAFFFLFISSVFILVNCEKENARARSYPRVNTMPVSGITEKGAKLNAELYSLGTEKITEHGFVWGSSTDPTFNSSNKILLGQCDSTGTYSAEIFTSLKKGIKYNVKSFVQTADHIVYGVAADFISLGSGAPTITSFEPLSAGWMDTVIIRGKNFSWVASENIVKLNQLQCQSLSSTDTTLRVLVNSELPDLKSIVSVELAGNLAVNIKDTFKLIAPSIIDIYPKQARWGDTITVRGKGFQSDKFYISVSAKIGGFTSTIIEKKNEFVKMLIPLELASIDNTLSLKIQNLLLSEKIGLIPPYISSIKPKEGTWGTVVTLKGKFHPTLSKNVITIGGFPATIVSNARDSIKVKIPQNLTLPQSVFLDKSSPFSVVSADTFKLFGPTIESVTPLFGTSNSNVTIKGKYLQDGNGSTIVKFGTISASITSHSSTQIDCKVPLNISNGPVNISLAVNTQLSTFAAPYNIKNPLITNISPLTGTFGNYIAIEGENLIINANPPSGFFIGKSMTRFPYIETVSENKLLVPVPEELDSIPQKIELDYPEGLSIYSSDHFTLTPPVITSVSASTLIPGQDISISGTGFNPNFKYNQVFWGRYPLIVKNSSHYIIVATVPSNIPVGFNKISIITGGYKRVYPTFFESRSAWSEIPIPPTLRWNSLYGGFGFSIKGLGYIIDQEGNMSSYNPVTKEFGDLGVHQEFKQVGFSKTVINDTLYAIGYNVTALTGLYRYDTGSNLWVYIAKAPSNYSSGIAFSLNGQLYYGLTIFQDNYNVTRDLWIFNRVTKTWIPKKQSPYFSYQRAVAYFTIGNRGYVLYMDKTFVEYNPDSDTWTKLTSYPGPGDNTHGLASFVLNNKGYVGLGKSEVYNSPPEYSDFWAYDPLNDKWTLVGSIPYSGRYYSTWFDVNNKVYIGFGVRNSSPIRDFYEFDPNYPAK